MPTNKKDDWFKQKSKSKNKNDKTIEEEVVVANDLQIENSSDEQSADVLEQPKKLKVRIAKALGFIPKEEGKDTWIVKTTSFILDSFTSGIFHRLYKRITSKKLLMKVLYTLLLLLFFRVLASITVPGITVTDAYRHNAATGSSFLGIMDLMGGGGIRTFSIVALGLGPYINASFVMQFLTSEAFPPLHRLTKSGPGGKRKINIITRCLNFAFAVPQAYGFIFTLSDNLTYTAGYEVYWFKYIVLPAILVAGSFFALFLGEQITNKGIGNGTSLIIFSGIAVNLPSQAKETWAELVTGNKGNSTFIGVLNLVIYVGVLLAVLYAITYFYLAERRIPIQQTGSGLQIDRNQMNHLPIKLNPAGVMPIIFALTVSVMPYQFSSFADHQNETRIWIANNMQLTQPIGLSMFIGLTFLFTISMSYLTINPATVADNFKKSGTFIPGVRPGEETEKYLWGILLRLSVFSSIYLSLIAAMQYIEQIIGLSNRMTISGTSLIIIVSVAIETINQLKARDKTHKFAKARIEAVSSKESDNVEKGLLW